MAMALNLAPEDEKEYDLDDPEDLIEFLIYANIRLVRFDFLCKLAREHQPCPRRQEAEQEEFYDTHLLPYLCKTVPALVTLEEYKSLRPGAHPPKPQPGGLFFYEFAFTSTYQEPGPGSKSRALSESILIVSVSHSWESKQHPDPFRFQLRCLCEKLERFRNPLHGQDVWVFIDWMCLPQYKRTDLEEKFFRRAMRSMHMLYAHKAVAAVERLTDLTPETERLRAPSLIDIYSESTGKFEPRPFTELVLNDTPYHLRGWCLYPPWESFFV